MNTQPEALRLADALTEEVTSYLCDEYPDPQQLIRATERAHGIGD